MARKERQESLAKLEAARDGRLCIAYVTSTRPGHEIQIADDMLRLLYEHLESGRAKAEKGVDLLIHTNGGSGTVPWRIVNVIREYAKSFALLVPHRAFSAGTLIALGADEIIMHRMGCLGPIDPSVANLFNPPHPSNPGQAAPISVEDVSAYFKLVQDEVGITHEDELVQALVALTEKVHPLALGNVQRHHQQSRLMAGKLLRKHLPAEKEHEINQIIDQLKSNLFFHGHPINRVEAKHDLKLDNVTFAAPPLEDLIWQVYLGFEEALKMREPFFPIHELEKQIGGTAPPAQLTTQQVVQQMTQLAQAGLGLGPLTEEQLVKIAVAMIPSLKGSQPTKRALLDKVPGAYVESCGRTDVFLTDLSLERITINTPAGPQDAIKQEVRHQRWEAET